MAEPIKIHFQTTADLQAGEEVVQVTREVQESVDSMTSGTTTSGGALPITVQVQEAAEAIGDAAQGAADLAEIVSEDLTDALDDAAGGADDLGENVAQIGRAQMAQIVSELAGMFGNLGAGIRKAAEDVREFDPQMAETLEKTGAGIEKVSMAAATMALGAAFGPVGVIAAATAVAVKTLGEEFLGMASAGAKASASAHEAAEMQLRLNEAIRDQAKSDAAWERVEAMEAETEAANGLLDALRRINALRDTEADAARKARDVEDAAAVRNGVPEEEVAMGRAKFDKDQALAKLEREAAAQAQAMEAAQAAEIKAREQERQAAEGDDPAAQAAAAATREAATAAKWKAAKDVVFGDKEREAKRAGIESDYEGRVAEQEDRLRRRQYKEKDLGYVDVMESELERERAAGGVKSRKAAVDFERDSQHPRIAGTPLQGRLADISKRLADGTNSNEVAQLIAQLEKATAGMNGKTLDGLKKVIALVQEHERKIDNLAGQVKNARTGR